jgi:hypothetical protein
VEILRSGLATEKVCLEVEAAIIDAIGLEKLTNKIRGHGTARGRKSAADIERLYSSAPIEITDIKEPCMMFFLKGSYSPTLSEQELYDATRQFWYNVSAKTRTPNQNGKLHYSTALAIADNVVVAIYSIAAWFPAGTTHSSRQFSSNSVNTRWEFIGQIDSKNKLRNKRLVKNGVNLQGNQIGYGYIN